MKFAELIATVTWTDVRDQLLSNYPEVKGSIKKYGSVFMELKKLKPVKSGMRIIIQETFREEIDESPFTEVTGRDGTLNKDLKDFKYSGKSIDSDYANSETDYALELTPWEKWLGMEIDTGTLKKYMPTQIVAHCLWEMTFLGFDQSQIRKERDELKRRIDELDAMTEEEKEKYLIPWEEVKKDLEKKYRS